MMRKRNRALVGALVVLLASGVTVGIVAASSGSDRSGGSANTSTAGFKPATLTGKWTGNWKNTTFNTTGSILAKVKFKRASSKFIPLVDFGGGVFGCSNPPSDTVVLKKGPGKNHWNSGGFKVSKQTKAFGNLKFNYKNSNHKVTGSGTAPAQCNPNITYTLNGKLTKQKFTATVNLDLGGGQKATAKLTANKQG